MDAKLQDMLHTAVAREAQAVEAAQARGMELAAALEQKMLAESAAQTACSEAGIQVASALASAGEVEQRLSASLAALHKQCAAECQRAEVAEAECQTARAAAEGMAAVAERDKAQLHRLETELATLQAETTVMHARLPAMEAVWDQERQRGLVDRRVMEEEICRLHLCLEASTAWDTMPREVPSLS